MPELTFEDLQELFDATPMGHVALTPDGEIDWMNRSALDLLGRGASDPIGIAFSRRIDPEDRSAFHQCLNAVLETDEPQTLDLRLLQEDGGRLPVRLHLAAARNRDGANRPLCATLMDISDLRRAEAAVERSALSAEAARRTQSEFLATMSHEFRTPLSAIIGFADILREERGLDESQKKHLEIIRVCGDHLLTLVEEILSLSRMDAGQSPLESVPFSLPSVVNHVFHVMRIKANEKSLSFRHETDAPLPDIVRGDKQKLTQVLMQLVGNAVKFTENGAVTVRTRYCDRHGMFRAAVADTGIGIGADDKDRIFAPFFRSRERGGYTEGPGLGLAVSKRYVEAMGGSLAVRSVRGRGSVFTVEVRLPADASCPSIIGVSADGVGHGRRRRFAAERDDFLLKPIDRRRLTEKLTHRLEPECVGGSGDCAPSTRKKRREAVALPPSDILNRIRDLARRGALNDLERALKSAAATDPALRPFCEAAAGFVDRCDEDGLLMFIQRMETMENGQQRKQ